MLDEMTERVLEAHHNMGFIARPALTLVQGATNLSHPGDYQAWMMLLKVYHEIVVP